MSIRAWTINVLLDLVLDDQVAKSLAPLWVCEKVVIAEEHDVGRDRLQFFNDRLERPFSVAPFLPERIETERAELAFERAASCCQYRVERVPAQTNTLLSHVIIMPSQRPVGKCNSCKFRQWMVFVVNDISILPIGQPTDILI